MLQGKPGGQCPGTAGWQNLRDLPSRIDYGRHTDIACAQQITPGFDGPNPAHGEVLLNPVASIEPAIVGGVYQHDCSVLDQATGDRRKRALVTHVGAVGHPPQGQRSIQLPGLEASEVRQPQRAKYLLVEHG